MESQRGQKRTRDEDDLTSDDLHPRQRQRLSPPNRDQSSVHARQNRELGVLPIDLRLTAFSCLTAPHGKC